jgi:hypothetical protein
VNLQATGAFVQIGIAKWNCYSSDCVFGWTNGQTDFCYTPDDQTAGDVYPATWVDFDGGGHDSHVVGALYQFEITRYVGMDSN